MSDWSSPMPALPPAPPPAPVGPEPAPRRRRSAPVIVAMVAVVALIAGAVTVAVTRSDGANAQPLALSFTQGQSQTYEIHQSMDADISSDLLGDQPFTMDVTQVVGWEVLSVAEDGTATIEVTVSEMSGSVNGTAIPATPTPPIEMVIAPDGRIVSAGGFSLGGAGQSQGFGFPGMGQLTPLLPDEGETVEVGDSWTKEFSQDFPFGEGMIGFSATSTYERDEVVDGRQAAVIVTEMTVLLDFTLSFADLLAQLGPEAAGASSVDPALFEDARIAYSGEGTIVQTSAIDLQAQELLRTEGSGTFDLVMRLSGIPGFEAADGTEIGFVGTFQQEVTLR